MLSVGSHIAHLLHHHECVIVPEFGGFIGNKKAGYANDKLNLFHPASLQVSFNKNLTNNDGLLANQLSKSEGILYQEATALVQMFKDACYAKLNEDGRLELDQVGVLFFDEEKNLQFQQSSQNFLLSSFGLSPSYIQPLTVEVEVEKVIEVEEKPIQRVAVVKTNRPAEKQVEAKPVQKSKKKRRGLAYALLVPVFVGGIFLGNQITLVNQGDAHLSAFGNFFQTPSKTYTPREVITTKTESQPVTTNAVPETVVEVKEPAVQPLEEVKQEIETPLVNISKDLNYHLIAGCFSDQENAEDFVKENQAKGYASQIVDKKGSLYRVSIQSFATRKEAIELKKELKSTEDLSSWVLKK